MGRNRTRAEIEADYAAKQALKRAKREAAQASYRSPEQRKEQQRTERYDSLPPVFTDETAVRALGRYAPSILGDLRQHKLIRRQGMAWYKVGLAQHPTPDDLMLAQVYNKNITMEEMLDLSSEELLMVLLPALSFRKRAVLKRLTHSIENSEPAIVVLRAMYKDRPIEWAHELKVLNSVIFE